MFRLSVLIIAILSSSPSLADTIPSITLTATPTLVPFSGSTTLVWSTTNVDTCKASGNWSGSQATNGSLTINSITNNKSFTLTCTGVGGTVTSSQNITAAPLPTVNFTATNNPIVIGGQTTLNWSTANATACTASGGWSGSQPLTGSYTTANLPKSTVFNLSCSGLGGTKTKSISITTSKNAGSQIGVNLAKVNDWTDYQYTFVDLMKQARTFVNYESPTSTIPVDVNGWPTSDATVYFMTSIPDVLGQSFTTIHPGVVGTYNLSFNGVGSVKARCFGVTISNVVYDKQKNLTTAQVTTDATISQIVLEFYNTQNGIQNIKLIRPGYAPNTTQVFTTEFLNAIKPFAALRFMDFLQTNANPITNWAERSKLTDPRQSSNKGVAWEYIIALANTTGKDIWINIPVNVDLNDTSNNNYVTQLAKLLKAKLNPKIHVYVEYSNELWNYSFSQAHDNYNAAVNEVNTGIDHTLNYDSSTNSGYWALRRIMHQTVKISQLFANVYGSKAINTTIRPVYMNQFAQPGFAKDGLNYLQQNFGIPNTFIYGIGGANYFYPTGNETNQADITTDLSLKLNKILAGFANSPITNISLQNPNTVTYQSLANYYGLKNLSYEGGADNGGTSALFVASGDDPSVNTMIQQELADAIGCGNALFMYFRLVGNSNDRWAMYSDFSIPTQKSQAVLTVANTPLLNYKTCTATANSQLYVQ